MPFKKGQSGNPKGKPKGATSKYTAAHVIEALENEFKYERGGFLGFITKKSRDSERFLIALLDKIIANADVVKEKGSQNVVVVFRNGSPDPAENRSGVSAPAETERVS